MAASLARRSTHLRNLWRPTRTTPISYLTSPPIQPNFTFQQTRILPIRSPSRFRRELTWLLPVHSAIASACLVSKLPSIADVTNEVSIDDGDLIAKLLPKINDGGEQEEPIKPLILRSEGLYSKEENIGVIMTYWRLQNFTEDPEKDSLYYCELIVACRQLLHYTELQEVTTVAQVTFGGVMFTNRFILENRVNKIIKDQEELTYLAMEALKA
ncbi:hypothetical protein GIB67_032252 [Kingdonia uniflora]|uniref:Uncharacterized protein n=1 Tax=Kingdonia uniflora TaxID=39325 RepID=A0A7J7MX08_9MAGN|nr:hypothetical protein GIB67_032252 [Kingdonia uniflora]